jgi:hypothetical protein
MPSSKHPFIHDFFSCYAIPEARREIKGLLEAAASNKVWKGKVPGNLLWLAEKLQELSSTVFGIDKWLQDERAIIVPNWEDYHWPANSPSTYCGWHKGRTTWDFMPRHLSRQEFANPYKALARFRAYRSEKEWNDIISELLKHALTPMGYEEFGHGNTMLAVEKRLYKLVEACHLIEVRTNGREIETEKSEKAGKSTVDSP